MGYLLYHFTITYTRICCRIVGTRQLMRRTNSTTIVDNTCRIMIGAKLYQRRCSAPNLPPVDVKPAYKQCVRRVHGKAAYG